MSRCSLDDEVGKRILSGRHSMGENRGEEGALHIPGKEGRRSRGWCSKDRRRRGQQVLWASGERGVIA